MKFNRPDTLGFMTDNTPGEEYWLSWAGYARPLLPRRVADAIAVVTWDPKRGFLVWWDGDYKRAPVLLPFSEDFPTELDIARLCVECP